jgi:hypothetical protein
VLRELDCPYFDSVEDLLAALRGMFDYYRFAPTISTLRRPVDLPTSLPSLTDLAQLVAAYGIAVPRAVACATSDQAVAAATTIGYPVVIKGSVSGVTHKTELQAVKLGLNDAADAAAAWQGIVASIAAHGLTDAFTGCIVQEQTAPGTELLLSIRRDAQFGPLVMVGAGGTLVELLHDVASAPAPISHEAALQMVRGLRIARLLDAWRGNPARDIEAIVDALVRLSWLAVDLGERLVDLEINPLIAGSLGASVRSICAPSGWGTYENSWHYWHRARRAGAGVCAGRAGARRRSGLHGWRAKAC